MENMNNREVNEINENPAELDSVEREWLQNLKESPKILEECANNLKQALTWKLDLSGLSDR